MINFLNINDIPDIIASYLNEFLIHSYVKIPYNTLDNDYSNYMETIMTYIVCCNNRIYSKYIADRRHNILPQIEYYCLEGNNYNSDEYTIITNDDEWKDQPIKLGDFNYNKFKEYI